MLEKGADVEYYSAIYNHFNAYFSTYQQLLKDNLPLVLQMDSESIHDIRVTSRRMRSLVQEFSPFLDNDLSNKLIRLARDVTKLFGKRREIDVIIRILLDKWKENNLSHIKRETINNVIQWLRLKQDGETQNCLKAVDILKQILGITVDERCFYVPRGFDFKVYTEKRVLKIIKKIRNFLDNAGFNETLDYDAPSVHELRVALKKRRYQLEVYQLSYPDYVGKLLDVMKTIQEYLGTWNDYRVLCIYLDEYLSANPEERHNVNLILLKIKLKQNLKIVFNDMYDYLINQIKKGKMRKYLKNDFFSKYSEV